MKAVIYRRYGSPAVLECVETPPPAPGDDEVLIRVRAASVNPLDWHFLRGMPYGFRFTTGLRKPRDLRLGMDVAGYVEAAGRNVTDLKAGDEVFGVCRGAFAEYSCAAASALAIKPANISFDQAAAAPIAALTALQGLRDQGNLQAGQNALINGAAGGVGTFAVQIARFLGAEVVGVCSQTNVELVRSLGANHVLDYACENFTQGVERYDLILDCIGNHPLMACRRVLQPHGTCVIVGAPSGRWIAPLDRVLRARLLSPFIAQNLAFFVAQANRTDLNFIADLMQTGRVAPVIGRQYSLAQLADAVRYVEGGHACGKVIVTMP